MGSVKRGITTDATRAERKAKKRKLEDAVADLPGDEGTGQSEAVEGEESGEKRRKKNEDGGGEVVGKKSKKDKDGKKKSKGDEDVDMDGARGGGEVEVELKDKKSKKDKKEKKSKDREQEVEPEPELELQDPTAEPSEVPRKSKKERKAERKAKEALEAANAGKSEPTTTRPTIASKGDGEKDETKEEKEKSKKNNRNREKKRKGVTGANAGAVAGEDAKASPAKEKEGKAARFIVFIGNLPFTATTPSIQSHFASVKPISIRHLTQKDNPSKSKGCAFIEFDGYDHMKTCLKLFHHSMFDDGVSAPRKINVELTAGGGGNTKDRRAKIQGKNQKLNEERVRKIQEEEKAKWEKKAAEPVDESGIHPSRRSRVPGAA